MPQDSEQDKKDRDAILAAFALLLLQSFEQMQSAVLDFSRGTSTLAQLTDALAALLFNGHTEATTLGRQLGGIDGDTEQLDKDFAATIMREQMPYLEGLIADIADGRYSKDIVSVEGVLTITGALLQRLKMYVRVMRSTALEAWALAQPGDTMIRWQLGLTEHCPDCPEIAAGGPYRADGLPSYPGDGSTACLANCDCELIVVGGEPAFPFPIL